MRRVSFRITFEALDRRENPGTSWGIFGLLGVVSSLLDNSHSKAKPEKKADHASVALASDKTIDQTLTHPTHAKPAAAHAQIKVESARTAKE